MNYTSRIYLLCLNYTTGVFGLLYKTIKLFLVVNGLVILNLITFRSQKCIRSVLGLRHKLFFLNISLEVYGKFSKFNR